MEERHFPAPDEALDWIKAAPTPFERLLRTMRYLRCPDGCAWDRKQTHQSLKRYALEEAYELAEAVDTGAPGPLQEELGDLLLQVVFHSVLAEEEGWFQSDDVVAGLCEKLWRRHEHVFGATVAQTPEAVEKAWEAVKTEERRNKAGLLAGVPKALPALARARRLGERAARAGFDWPDVKGVLEKVVEECRELAEDRSNGKDPAREFGDILFALVNLARHLEVDAEEALQVTNNRFMARFSHIEERLLEQDRTPAQASLQELDALWEEAKALERKGKQRDDAGKPA